MYRRFYFMAIVLTVAVMLMAGVTLAAVPTSIVKIDPLGFIQGLPNISYEKVVDTKLAIVVSGDYVNWNLGTYTLTTVGGGTAYRYYFEGNTPTGFYIGPQVSIDLATVSSTTTTAINNSVAFGGGIAAGFQWILDTNLAMDVQANITATFGSTTVDNATINLGGTATVFGFFVGYAW